MAMTKQVRSLVSTFLVGAIGATIMWVGYFSTRASNEARSSAAEEEAKAFDFQTEEARKLVLARGTDTIVAEKIEGRWRLTSPVDAPADEFAVESIVKTLADWKAKDLNADAKPRKAPDFALADVSKAVDFGLDAPATMVVLTLVNGESHTLKLGEPSPYDRSRPFLVEGQTNIRLAAGGEEAPLEKTVFDLRDKSVASFQSSDITSVVFSSPESSWTVERNESGWLLTSPFADTADTETIDGILNRLRGAKAKAFVEGDAISDLASHGLDVLAATISLRRGADGEADTLEFRKTATTGVPKLYVRRPEAGPFMELEPDMLGGLLKSAEDVRDHHVVPFERAKVGKLLVRSGDESFVVIREMDVDGDERFSLQGDADRKLKAWKITSALHSLATLKGQRLVTDDAVELATWGLDAPVKSFEVSAEGGAELARLLIGKDAADGRVYAMQAGSKRVYEVEKSTIASLPGTKSDILDEALRTSASPEE